VPFKTIAINGNCKVDDRGLETHHGRALNFFAIFVMSKHISCAILAPLLIELSFH
jgi:hypothetical protein